jgi:hypothetical protein
MGLALWVDRVKDLKETFPSMQVASGRRIWCGFTVPTSKSSLTSASSVVIVDGSSSTELQLAVRYFEFPLVVTKSLCLDVV